MNDADFIYYVKVRDPENRSSGGWIHYTRAKRRAWALDFAEEMSCLVPWMDWAVGENSSENIWECTVNG